MVVCPVCEHQQAFGLECEVCGKDLGDLGMLGPPPVAPVAIEGLEVTVAERIGEVPVERVGELEVTSFQTAAMPVATEAVPDLDTGKAASLGPIAVERMAELSADRAPDDGVRTQAPTGAVTCRYCRNVQASGLICNTCGMKLPKAAAAPPPPTTGKAGAVEARSIRCRACGAPATPGQRCSECGAQQPPPA
jgi:hypothetical protein